MSNLHFGLVNSALWPLGHLGPPPWETESRAQDVLSPEKPTHSVAGRPRAAAWAWRLGRGEERVDRGPGHPSRRPGALREEPGPRHSGQGLQEGSRGITRPISVRLWAPSARDYVVF